MDTSVCYTTYTIKATFYTELRHCGVIRVPQLGNLRRIGEQAETLWIEICS